MRPPAWLTRVLAPLAGLALLASLTGCGDSIVWITQPNADAAILQTPIQLRSGDFVSSGYIVRGDDYSSYAQGALVKLTSDGKVRETRVYNADWIQVDRAADDQLVFVGNFNGAGFSIVTRVGLMDSEGTERWSLPIPGVTRVGSLDRTSLYALGYDSDGGFLRVLDLEGAPLWTYVRNDFSLVRPAAAGMVSNGDVIVAGLTGKSLVYLNSFITRLDPGGTPLWTRDFLGARIAGIAVDPTTGSTYFTGEVDGHLLLGAVDAAGNDVFWELFEEEKTSSPGFASSGATIALGPPPSFGATELLVGGRLYSNADLGLDPLTADRDALLLVTDTDGEALWQLLADGPGWDTFSARWADDGSILAALLLTTADYEATGKEVAHVAGHDVQIRANADTALMQIRR